MNPEDVHDTLRRHLLVDGFDLVLDTRASHGSWIVDARDGTRYLDLFSFFASAPLGMNPPALVDDPAFLAELTEVAVNKPSNSDVYTVAMARFVEVFSRVVGDPALPHLFFVEGGGPAVENALKTAFDWKRRHNAAHGRPAHLGTRVLHLTRAFHGRGGYSLSLTNTDPVKTALFPVFDWPRIDVPATHFPGDVAAAEARALEQARAAFAAHPHDIACFVAEPIQGEGGDNHLRPEFLQAVQALCMEHDALFVLDEVQTGGGMTGTAWAYQQLGVAPDVVAFGKKLQVCGVMAGGRVDEVPDNVFRTSSRINSTWGGNLTDMVRARRYLEVMESDGLFARAAALGTHLRDALSAVPGLSSVRGRGLFCAADLPTPAARDAVLAHLLREERVLMLGSGARSVRFRPALTITAAELDLAVAALTRAVAATASAAAAA
ncbi:L-lysine 6-transaminase [Pseudonocardia sp. KRD-184]|uniref:L-lysine 6-transaminase n=2 Tax=Pseudonocardia oceani TaxID=2792013 RepID=A0ABS6U4N1_9PSEU|nr:L-lysine 6-transaminase [Pseudonocardia oceani]MBW0096707.1 L-lysine 6-transaminase [Pseudonocardia oceani]MBW0123982.1 L-lysine 6-transaminase [Pseudonocardia oceani]MBW0127187.1 L-lysine 6-transaminase [Pseudonocardia oceani]